jgi:ribosomal protein S18 acetylase RimI-like enzyme
MSGRSSIRFAAAADLVAVHALIERSYRGAGARLGWTHEADLLEGERTNAAELAAIVSDPRSRILMLESLGELVGCVHIADRGNAMCYLGLLCVDPRHQAAGFGKQLMSAAEAFGQQLFRAMRLEMTVIEQRAELIAYYERRGYARTGERRPFPVRCDPPLHLIVLTKRLAPVR